VQVIGLGAYLQMMPFKNIYDYQEKHEESLIKISFEKLVDINVNLNFFAMVYQECYTTEYNELMIYDIDLMDVVQCIDINPNLKTIHYMYSDDQGFNSFKIVRACDLKK